MRGMRKAAPVAGVLGLALALGACGNGTEEVAAEETVVATDTVTEVDQAPVPGVADTEEPVVEETEAATEEAVNPYVWPLTGMPTDEVVARPAVGVKIENSTAARPQIGLEFADMVWEEVVEGGISRFIAVYNSDIPDVVAPIRSARSTDAGVVAPLGGLLVYSGAQPGFIADINNAGVQSVIMDSGNAGFARLPDRRAPHNVVGDMEAFLAQARSDRQSPPPSQAHFANDAAQATAAVSGTPANQISVRMSNVQTTNWTWDEATGRYLRSDFETPSVSNTGERHSAANVIAVSVQQVDTGTVDAAGNPVPEAVVVGTGPALIATGGRSIEGTWSKESMSAPMRFLDANGNDVDLAPGETWLMLMPSAGNWTVS